MGTLQCRFSLMFQRYQKRLLHRTGFYVVITNLGFYSVCVISDVFFGHKLFRHHYQDCLSLLLRDLVYECKTK